MASLRLVSAQAASQTHTPRRASNPALSLNTRHPQPHRNQLRHRRCPASSADGSNEQAAPAVVPVEQTNEAGPRDEGMDKVQEAMMKVQAALAEAEQNVEVVHTLPSAKLPSKWERTLSTLRPAIQLAALAAACAAMHSLGPVARVLGSLGVGLSVAAYGWHRSSLSASGAIAAALVGWGTLAASFRYGMLLLTFFFASSKLTKLGEELKDVDEEHKQGGQRDWRQVCCNALVPTGLALAAACYSGGTADLAFGQAALGRSARLLTALNAAFLGYYSCCCGDTWASELGQLSPEEPRLITTLRPVRKGTNGGVTLAGLGASLAGGLAMGLTFLLASLASPAAVRSIVAAQWWRLLVVGLMAGLVGSLIDSLLGATIQFTGFNRASGKLTGRPGPDVSPISGWPVLDNNGVNAVSASLTAALTAVCCVFLFC